MKRSDFIRDIGAMGLLTAMGSGWATNARACGNKVSDNHPTDDKRLRIDAHTHLAAIDRKNHQCFISEETRNSISFKFYIRSLKLKGDFTDEEFDIAYAKKMARLVREAKYVDKAVLFALDGAYNEKGELDDRTALFISNIWTAEVCKKYPDEFLLGASIHPARPDALDELDKYAEAGAVCVKWIPNSMNINPSDGKIEKFYERMKKHGLILSSHTGYEHGPFTVDQSFGDPKRLKLPLDMGLTVVAGHAGTSGFYHRVEYFPNFVEMVGKYENLYGDTAAITELYRGVYRKRLLNTPIVKDRIIQGTDFPIPSIPLVWPIALGPIKAMKMQSIDNMFDKDYLAKKAVGFPEEHFRRGHDVFLGNA